MKGTNVAIGHLDADCFYVSAERVRFAELRGVSVGVLGNQGACVIAKSYEMKKHGVKTGMPIWDALKLCPTGAYVKRDFRWYEVLSRSMLEIVKEYSWEVEYYSIDEFFFRARVSPPATFHSFALAIQTAIHERVGVPVSVGIARSRTLAKLISDTVKPFGVGVLLDEDAEREFLREIPITEIAGIAERRAKRLLPWGIKTCLDLLNADRRLVRKLLTASGEVLWWELHGEPAQPIHTKRVRHKALSRGGSFGESTDNPLVIYAWLVRNLERLIEELEFHCVMPQKFTVWVAYRNGAVGAGSSTLAIASDRFETLLEVGRYCLRRAYIPKQMATRMHLIAEDLRNHTPMQLGLFEVPDQKSLAVANVKRRINERYGRFVLRSGATLPLHAIYQDKANGYDICDVRGKSCF
jgi:DNA polymerase V